MWYIWGVHLIHTACVRRRKGAITSSWTKLREEARLVIFLMKMSPFAQLSMRSKFKPKIEVKNPKPNGAVRAVHATEFNAKLEGKIRLRWECFSIKLLLVSKSESQSQILAMWPGPCPGNFLIKGREVYGDWRTFSLVGNYRYWDESQQMHFALYKSTWGTPHAWDLPYGAWQCPAWDKAGLQMVV